MFEVNFASELHATLLAQGIVNLEDSQYSQQLLDISRKKVREQGSVYEPSIAVRYKGVPAGYRADLWEPLRLLRRADDDPGRAHGRGGGAYHPWSVNHNNDPHNGMALCRLCHWTFDEGLVSVSSRYLILLSGQLLATLNKSFWRRWPMSCCDSVAALITFPSTTSTLRMKINPSQVITSLWMKRWPCTLLCGSGAWI